MTTVLSITNILITQTYLSDIDSPIEDKFTASSIQDKFTISPPCFHAAAAAAKSLQSCPTLCNPIEGSPPGSSVPGILQARMLEWGANA